MPSFLLTLVTMASMDSRSPQFSIGVSKKETKKKCAMKKDILGNEGGDSKLNKYFYGFRKNSWWKRFFLFHRSLPKMERFDHFDNWEKLEHGFNLCRECAYNEDAQGQGGCVPNTQIWIGHGHEDWDRYFCQEICEKDELAKGDKYPCIGKTQAEAHRFFQMELWETLDWKKKAVANVESGFDGYFHEYFKHKCRYKCEWKWEDNIPQACHSSETNPVDGDKCSQYCKQDEANASRPEK